jgi:hypothetical protein
MHGSISVGQIGEKGGNQIGEGMGFRDHHGWHQQFLNIPVIMMDFYSVTTSNVTFSYDPTVAQILR